jgi:hypothetical protein
LSRIGLETGLFRAGTESFLSRFFDGFAALQRDLLRLDFADGIEIP